MDALGAATELQFGISTARYSHADWEREQYLESTCHATIRYIILGRPLTLPDDLLPRFHLRQRPAFSKFQELDGKG